MRAGTRSYYAEVVQRSIERIVRGLDEPLELGALASDAAMSPFHFHRVFRGMVGETPVELLRRLRLERAALRLKTTADAVTDIAFDAGYETHEAFTRAFRGHFSTSPSGFRRRSHPRIELAAPSGIHFNPGGTVPPFIPRDSGGRTMHVDIRTMPALRLATVRHVGPYNQIPTAFARLGQTLGTVAGDLMRSGSSMIAIYHDDPEAVPIDRLRSDACVSLPEGAGIPEGLVEASLPAGDYACTVHVGPYEHLGDAWARFMGEWLPGSGRRLVDAGVCYERYLNNPTQVAPEDLKTELYVPLQ